MNNRISEQKFADNEHEARKRLLQELLDISLGKGYIGDIEDIVFDVDLLQESDINMIEKTLSIDRHKREMLKNNPQDLLKKIEEIYRYKKELQNEREAIGIPRHIEQTIREKGDLTDAQYRWAVRTQLATHLYGMVTALHMELLEREDNT